MKFLKRETLQRSQKKDIHAGLEQLWNNVRILGELTFIHYFQNKIF